MLYIIILKKQDIELLSCSTLPWFQRCFIWRSEGGPWHEMACHIKGMGLDSQTSKSRIPPKSFVQYLPLSYSIGPLIHGKYQESVMQRRQYDHILPQEPLQLLFLITELIDFKSRGHCNQGVGNSSEESVYSLDLDYNLRPHQTLA